MALRKAVGGNPVVERPSRPRRRSFHHGALALTLTVTLAACGLTGPDSVPNIAGNWSGSIIDYQDGSRGHSLTIVLLQQGSSVTGVLLSPMNGFGIAGPSGGPMQAAVDGQMSKQGVFQFTANAVDMNGCYDITATMTLDTRDDTMDGEYSVSRTGTGCGREAVGRTRALGVGRSPS